MNSLNAPNQPSSSASEKTRAGSVESATFRSLKSTLIVFCCYFFLIFILGILGTVVFIDKTTAYCWGIACFVCFFAGIVSFLAANLFRKKYGTGLGDALVGSACRTGIPLTTALAFFGVFDNIILIRILFSLAVVYLATLPCEVGLFLPATGKTKANLDEKILASENEDSNGDRSTNVKRPFLE